MIAILKLNPRNVCYLQIRTFDYTLGIFWLKHTKKGMIAYFHICSTVFDRDLEFISQFLLPKGNQKIYDFKLFQCDNLAFFKESVGAFM